MTRTDFDGSHFRRSPVFRAGAMTLAGIVVAMVIAACGRGRHAGAADGGAAATQPSQPAAQQGAEQVIQVRSESFKKDLPATVVLPAGYNDPPNAAKRYRLLVLLHGAGGDHRDWAQQSDLKALATKYDLVIVAPTAGPNSWWVDYAGDPPNFAETYVAKELTAALRKTYRIREGGGHWITGNSMGGYGALRIGLGHPELFSAAGGLSACMQPRRWRDKWDLTTAMGRPGGRVSLFGGEQVQTLRDRKGLALSVLCGRRDSLFMNENRSAHAALANAGIAHQWLDIDGQHNGEFWKAYLPKQLEYFREQSAKAETEAATGPSGKPAQK